MNSPISDRTSRRDLVSLRRAAGLALVAAAIGSSVAFAQETSLQPLLDRVEQQAKLPEERDKAIEGYRQVIDAHLDNGRVFDDAMRGLAKSYLESDRAEEGARFFLEVLGRMEEVERRKMFQDVLAQFEAKHPGLIQKLAKERRSNDAAVTVPAVDPTNTLSAAILQREDAARRAEALDKVKRFLSSDEEQDHAAGLAALRSALPAKFDRGPFRPLVAKLVASGSPRVKILAVSVLPALEPTEKELDIVLPLVDDLSPRVRAEVGPALVQIAQGQHAGKVIPALSKLLADDEPRVVERTIRGMWGQYSSPEFDKLLIELADDPRWHHWAIYHGLSTMPTKSVAIAERLIDELDDPDWNNSGRAAWGLTYGVPAEAREIVEQGLLRALPEETNPYTRGQEFRALRAVATERSRPYLQSVVDSPNETEEAKQAAREILKSIER